MWTPTENPPPRGHYSIGASTIWDQIGDARSHARTTGTPCRAKALPNGRCKLHGGMSTGPKTLEGKQAIGAATKARMAAGQSQKVQEGHGRWLDAGGREYLSRLAKRRAARLKWKNLMT